jgi:hypothetical protein
MKKHFSNADLEAYLDEALTPELTAEIETVLREGDSLTEQLTERLAALTGQRDAGVHSLGGVWRRHRLSCPSREQLGSLLLGVLKPAHFDYVQFHLKAIGCRACKASLSDLEEQYAAANKKEISSRRQKYFQSSAGYLEGREE